jgi:hypothetical protein
LFRSLSGQYNSHNHNINKENITGIHINQYRQLHKR